MKKNSRVLVLVAFALMFFATGAFASSTGLPWEDPLTAIVNSIKGPVAFGISVIAIVAAGAGLIFGGEIGGFLKTLIILALVVSLIVLAVNILTGVFGIGSAVIF